MEITDKMMRAAGKAYNSKEGRPRVEAIRAALEAVLSAQAQDVAGSNTRALIKINSEQAAYSIGYDNPSLLFNDSFTAPHVIVVNAYHCGQADAQNHAPKSSIFREDDYDLPTCERKQTPIIYDHAADDRDSRDIYIEALAEEKTWLARQLSNLHRAPAILDVAYERSRQIYGEGWSEIHDDIHKNGEIAGAAACYVLHYLSFKIHNINLGHQSAMMAKNLWPWSSSWWKPAEQNRRNLIKAAALIIAEIERLDRAAPPAKQEG